jgi:hypothetical protein
MNVKEFPKLMINKNGTIIIAKGYDTDSNYLRGVVIHTEAVRQHISLNIEWFYTNRFEDYDGELILKNE